MGKKEQRKRERERATCKAIPVLMLEAECVALIIEFPRARFSVGVGLLWAEAYE